MQGFDVLYFERLEVQIVEPKHGNCVLQVEPEHEALEEVSTFLYGSNVLGVLRSLQLDSSSFGVHSNLQFHVLDERLQDAVPFLLQGCEPVPWHWDSPVLVLLPQVTNVDLVELYLLPFLLDRFHLGELLALLIIDVCIDVHTVEHILFFFNFGYLFFTFNLYANATNC